MSGHFICESCGYDGGDHAKWCREMRLADERWKGNKTRKEVEAEAASSLPRPQSGISSSALASSTLAQRPRE
jgi:hypothetical protein